jgi:peptidoglycan/LPS O-acetylase OafA/YrhL
MFLILFHHFEVHAISDGDAYHSIYRLTYPFFICGVNLFFMISGWCQIKSPFRALVKTAVMVSAFFLVNALLCCIVGTNEPIWKSFAKVILFPLTATGYWFISVYALLIIIAPIVNIAFRNMDIKSLRWFVGLFTAFTVYSCGVMHNMSNANGYSFTQGLYMYCLAAYLRRDEELFKKIKRSWLIVGYFAVIIICAIVMSWLWIPADLYYNSLPMVLAASLLFLYVTRFKFQSKLVNRLGAASLGCYLLQDGLFGVSYFYGVMHKWFVAYPTLQWMGMYAAVFIAIWVASLLLTPPIQRIAKAAASISLPFTKRVTL